MPVLGVTPTNAPPAGKTPRSGGAPRSRQPPATFDSSLAPAAASRPSLSPSCSSASASRLAASAVCESQFCAHLRLILPHCVARAPPAPSESCPFPHWACKALQGIYIPSSPIWPAATGRSRNAQHRHIGPRAGADNVLASLLVAWRSHGDNSAMKSLTSGAKRSYLDLPVINALAIVLNATTQQMQLSAAQGCFRRRE